MFAQQQECLSGAPTYLILNSCLIPARLQQCEQLEQCSCVSRAALSIPIDHRFGCDSSRNNYGVAINVFPSNLTGRHAFSELRVKKDSARLLNTELTILFCRLAIKHAGLDGIAHEVGCKQMASLMPDHVLAVSNTYNASKIDLFRWLKRRLGKSSEPLLLFRGDFPWQRGQGVYARAEATKDTSPVKSGVRAQQVILYGELILGCVCHVSIGAHLIKTLCGRGRGERQA
mmetsp:Transcript_85532/g.149072  ORF Transcript_85532/g.149072 Transcript_85532/m.149072 type:complete len:230 (+) Transcript_85532:409-1098(+)